MIDLRTYRFSRRGFSLLEILVVMVILVALSGGVAFFLLGRGGAKGTAKAPTPLDRAHGTVCMTNLRSVRQAIAAAQAGDTDGKYPQTLEELKLPAELLKCDDGKEPYVYDPQTGQVHCIHPGHDNY